MKWVLVQWIKERSITVMEESEETIDKREGEEVNVNYNGKKYKAILKMRSGKY